MVEKYKVQSTKGPEELLEGKVEEGFVLVNKPLGWTSFDVIKKIRASSGIKKVGHAGTLDPAAEGLLLVAIGRRFTREINKYVQADKEYIAEITFGVKTDSSDRDGQVLETRAADIAKDAVEKVLKDLIGIQSQIPPMHSAIKYKGRKLYELARQGKEIERKARMIEVKEAELLEYNNNEFPKIKVRFVCSKGTYVRTLAEEIGQRLNTIAFLSGLKRTKIGEFELKDAVEIKSQEPSTNDQLL